MADSTLLINLPLRVTIPRKRVEDKKWIANLNVYRNTHYGTLNDVKKLYSEEIRVRLYDKHGHIPQLPSTRKYTLSYTLFPASRGMLDVMNPCSIIDKFTCDALVSLGVFPDDNYGVMDLFQFRMGAVDKENPRCELLIEEHHG